jgi:hypothetical protein
MNTNRPLSSIQPLEGELPSTCQSRLLHSLCNKLLPIVVFSELALRHCQDETVKRQLEKIHGAAGDARDIILEIKKLNAGKEAENVL